MHGIVRYSFTIVASFCIAVLAGERAFGQVLKGEPAYGGWHDDRSGLRRVLTPQDLPLIEKPIYGLAQVIPIPTSAPPQVPDGFSVELATPALRKLRVIRGAPSVLSFDSDGTHMQIVTTGLHNCGGITVQLATVDLWVAHSNGVLSPSSPRAFTMQQISLIVTQGGDGTIWRVAYHETAQGTHNADTGLDLYIAHCSACHQASGEGLLGVMPPLKGSGVVNKEAAGKHIKIVLNGTQGAPAGGVVYAAVMPPFAGALNDAEISDIINYERRSWGNHGTPVTAAQVALQRARPK